MYYTIGPVYRETARSLAKKPFLEQAGPLSFGLSITRFVVALGRGSWGSGSRV